MTTDEPPRGRFTGRAALLVLVLAVLAVSYASSLRAYVAQRSHVSDLKAQIAAKQADIESLEREKARWQDPEYVQQQARERFGYLFPGETAYVVVGVDGQPLDHAGSLDDPDAVPRQTPAAWWEKAWGSVELAGNPPPAADPPAAKIRQPATKIDPGQG